MTAPKASNLNERRDRTTRRIGNGRSLWLRINHDREAMAIWAGYVLTALTQEEMFERAKAAFADELERHYD